MVRCPSTALTALSRPNKSSFTFSALPALAYNRHQVRNISQKEEMNCTHKLKRGEKTNDITNKNSSIKVQGHHLLSLWIRNNWLMFHTKSLRMQLLASWYAVKILSKMTSFFSAGRESTALPCKSFSNSWAEKHVIWIRTWDLVWTKQHMTDDETSETFHRICHNDLEGYHHSLIEWMMHKQDFNQYATATNLLEFN